MRHRLPVADLMVFPPWNFYLDRAKAKVGSSSITLRRPCRLKSAGRYGVLAILLTPNSVLPTERRQRTRGSVFAANENPRLGGDLADAYPLAGLGGSREKQFVILPIIQRML